MGSLDFLAFERPHPVYERQNSVYDRPHPVYDRLTEHLTSHKISRSPELYPESLQIEFRQKVVTRRITGEHID